MNHSALCVGLVGLVVTGCGGTRHIAGTALLATDGVSSGPGSGLWGDGGSGPSGMHVGCIDGRRFAVMITAHNRSSREVLLQAAGGSEDVDTVLRRVAVQVHLAPPPPSGDQEVIGLRGWNGRDSRPASIPAEGDAWIQSNFLMHDCRTLHRGESLIANRSMTLTYRTGGRTMSQVVSPRYARMILTRGPLHPSLAINQVG